MAEHLNPSFITSHKHDWSQGTNWSATRVLMGDGTWTDKAPFVYVANTVFVSKSGNDLTGVVERFDLPFLTIAAARTSVLAYWTGGTAPSASNRIRIVVQSGRYLEQLVLANYVDWDLTNIVLDLQAGALYTIDDLNVACNSIIYGNATILRSTAGTLGCIRTQNAGTILRGTFDYVTSTIGVCVNSITAASIQILKARSFTGVSTALFCSGGGVQYIYGDVISNSAGANCTSGSQYIYGNITGAGVGIGASNSGSSIQTVYGNITADGTGAQNNTGTQTVYGNIASSSAFGLNCVAGTQNIYGNTTGASGATVAVASGTGIQNIVGNVTNAGSGRGASCTDTAKQTITGNVTGITIGAIADAGTQIINGNITSSTSTGIQCQGSAVQIINNSRISTGVNTDCVLQTGGTQILKNCTLLTSGTGVSISNSSTVQLQGHNDANVAIGTSVTLTGSGSLSVSSTNT